MGVHRTKAVLLSAALHMGVHRTKAVLLSAALHVYTAKNPIADISLQFDVLL